MYHGGDEYAASRDSSIADNNCGDTGDGDTVWRNITAGQPILGAR